MTLPPYDAHRKIRELPSYSAHATIASMSTEFSKQKKQELRVEKIVQYLKIAGYGIAIILVGMFVGRFMKSQNLKKQNEAFAALFVVRLIEKGEADQPLSPFSFSSVESWDDTRKEKYQKELQDVIDQHPDSSAALIAGLKLGRYHVQLKENKKAESAYRQVVRLAEDNEHAVYKAMAYESLGVIFENQENYNEAGTVFAAAVEMKTNPLLPLSRLGLARNLSKQGEKDKAGIQYDKLIEEFPDTEYSRRARVLKSYLNIEGA